MEIRGRKSLNLGIFETTAERLLFQPSVSRDHPVEEGKLLGWVKYEHIWFDRWVARSRMEMCVLSLGQRKNFLNFL